MCSKTLSALALRNFGQSVRLGAVCQIARISEGNSKLFFSFRGMRGPRHQTLSALIEPTKDQLPVLAILYISIGGVARALCPVEQPGQSKL